MKATLKDTVFSLLPLLHVAAGTDYVVQVVQTGQSICSGQQTEQRQCTSENQTCACTPLDCAYSAWGAWSTVDCSGLASRTRTITTQNNYCGTACSGNLTETQQGTPPTTCSNFDQNCEMDEWAQWTPCISVNGAKAEYDQITRTRTYKNAVHGAGTACNDTLKETRSCGTDTFNRDCKFNDWNSWTTCSRTCGDGWQTRYREFVKKKNDGTLCTGPIKQLSVCGTDACPTPTCPFTQWTDWQGCDDYHTHEKIRERTIITNITTACNGSTKEVMGCAAGQFNPVDCTLEQWSDWSGCTRTCGGGDQTRTRNMATPPKNNGKCNNADGTPLTLTEIQGCNTDTCYPNICVYTDWTAWDTCSMPCGPGTQRRSRSVDMGATNFISGGCAGSVKEIQPCQIVACATTNCLWDDWHAWSGCTASCGGGTKRRNRQITQNPSPDGILCPANNKAEASYCNTQACHTTVLHATWGLWSAWAPCSKSCGGAYQKRTRDIATPNSPNGAPVTGYFSEFRNCSTNPPCVPAIDCELTQWAQWSVCSSSCFGIRHRGRTIKTFANEVGKACAGALEGNLKIIEACNPGPGEVTSTMCDATPARDCVLEAWSQWSSCPVTCGGGQEYRTRHILSPPSHRGQPCSNALGETRPCQGAGASPCARVCYDCKMNAWGSWGACSSCKGQRYRSRNIQQHPNYCGTQCESYATREIEACVGECTPDLYCSWSVWTDFEGCNAQCGPATKKRQRSLHLSTVAPTSYLFKGKAPITCSGTVFRTESCPYVECPRTCVKTDCTYQQWSAWSTINMDSSNAVGLCRRHRSMLTIGNCGGTICSGNLEEGKACARPGTLVVNCEIRDWQPWSQCHAVGQQQERVRSIKRLPQNGGLACSGDFHETQPCVGTHNFELTTNCTWQQWFDWSYCSATCGTGWKLRHRSNQPPMNGGMPCNGALKELASCDMTSLNPTGCDVGAVGAACTFKPWEPWGMCLSSGQRTRRREVLTYARVGDTPCNGTLEELGSCGWTNQDCVLSAWTDWGSCKDADGNTVATCGRGQTSRNRQIDINPSIDGAACPTSLREIQGCGSETNCPSDDCSMSDWSDWASSTGSATCGASEQFRSRTIVSIRTSLKGVGCEGAMEEYRSETVTACPVCTWPDWGAWSACGNGGTSTADCKSCEKSRARAKPAGVACDGVNPIKEYTQCNSTVSCETCTDATWGLWGAWGTCQAGTDNCGSGFQERTRTRATIANSCGKPVVGNTQEIQPCNAGACANVQNCVWGDWADWGACSKTCSGNKMRSRVVKTAPTLTGTPCTGSYEETFPCNPTWSTDTVGTGTILHANNPTDCPVGLDKKDCILGDWADWSCSATCGNGQALRARTVTQYQEHQGIPCEGALSEAKVCNVGVCPNQPTSCTLSDWAAWGACDSCQGQMERIRTVVQGDPEGEPCPANATKETMGCGSARNCAANKHFCAWEDWGPWAACDAANCANGKQTRIRRLQNKVGTRRISFGAQPSPIDVPNGQKVKYTRAPQQCVEGHDLGPRIPGKSVEECASLCEDHPRCVTFESGFDYGGIGGALEGDCQLKDDCNTTECDGAHSNVDLYIKVGYKKIAASCVTDHNINNLKYSGKSLDECQRLCDATPNCVSLEYGVAYGGSGAFLPGDCMLNDASDPEGCDGADQNLDLYVKAACSSASSSPSQLQASVLYEREDTAPEAAHSVHHRNLAFAFGSGIALFAAGAFVWRAISRRDSTYSYEPLSRTPMVESESME